MEKERKAGRERGRVQEPKPVSLDTPQNICGTNCLFEKLAIKRKK